MLYMDGVRVRAGITYSGAVDVGNEMELLSEGGPARCIEYVEFCREGAKKDERREYAITGSVPTSSGLVKTSGGD